MLKKDYQEQLGHKGFPRGPCRCRMEVSITLHTWICIQFSSRHLPSCLGNSEVLERGPAHPSLPATAGDRWTGGCLCSRALAHLETVSLHPFPTSLSLLQLFSGG